MGCFGYPTGDLNYSITQFREDAGNPAQYAFCHILDTLESLGYKFELFASFCYFMQRHSFLDRRPMYSDLFLVQKGMPILLYSFGAHIDLEFGESNLTITFENGKPQNPFSF